MVFAAFKHSKFVNRGFLLGPVCPIYGFGVIAVIYLLSPMLDRQISVFIMSVLITSAVEFAVGWLAEKVLHTRLWDYSDCFMNIGGYICLVFSLLWGIGCMSVVYIFQPLIEKSRKAITSHHRHHGNTAVYGNDYNRHGYYNFPRT